jgi:hypothetical protein
MPEKSVIPDLGPVVKDASKTRILMSRFNNCFQLLVFKVSARDQFIQVGYIRLMMFAMMKGEGFLRNMGLQSVKSVR